MDESENDAKLRYAKNISKSYMSAKASYLGNLELDIESLEKLSSGDLERVFNSVKINFEKAIAMQKEIEKNTGKDIQ